MLQAGIKVLMILAIMWLAGGMKETAKTVCEDMKSYIDDIRNWRNRHFGNDLADKQHTA